MFVAGTMMRYHGSDFFCLQTPGGINIGARVCASQACKRVSEILLGACTVQYPVTGKRNASRISIVIPVLVSGTSTHTHRRRSIMYRSTRYEPTYRYRYLNAEFPADGCHDVSAILVLYSTRLLQAQLSTVSSLLSSAILLSSVPA
jgi:hypothetical protein